LNDARNTNNRGNDAVQPRSSVHAAPIETRELDERQKKTLTPEETAEKRKRNIYRRKVIFGLFSPFCLQALDTTIVVFALPFIAEDFSLSSSSLNRRHATN
jgi:hypothetical protein